MNTNLILHERGKDSLYKIWHASSRALFMYVHSGSGSIVTKDRNYPIQNNILTLITPGTYHNTMPDDPNRYVRSKLILSPDKFTGIADLLRSHSEIQNLFNSPITYACIPPEMQDSIGHILAEAASCSNADIDAPLLLSCVLRLLGILNKYIVKSTSDTPNFMGKAIQYINENISSDLNLDQICSAINMSKYYFCRQFKLHLGMTVMQYILNTRLILAKDELEKNDNSITLISEKYGFSSVSYFCQVFKAENGCTPLQYRKKLKGP